MREADILAVVAPAVAAADLEVDRLEIASAGKRGVLRLFLDGDGPNGLGPSLDQIAEATQAISRALDASDATGTQPYVLEVSSRGATRPLTEPKHYRRNRGRLVEIQRVEGAPVLGRIVAVADDAVTLQTDAGEATVPFAGVRRAVVQVELNRPLTAEEEAAFAAAEDEED